ncbi:MAG TPA: hypothetical protein VFX59_19245 [Polyangiales bacterium]|nr:hypothetical protein [Polyangiales bacterium]
MAASFHEEVELRIRELVGTRDEWAVAPGTSSQVEIAIAVTYRVAFGSVFEEARPGPLPASAMKFEPAPMRVMVEALRATKARALEERLEQWLAEQGASDAILAASTCLGSAPTFGYELSCEGCAAGRTQACDACGSTGVRHVLGTVSCHVGRKFEQTLTGLPENAPAWLRDATSAAPFRAVTELELVELRCEPGLVRQAFKGALTIEQCEVTVRDEKLVVWSFGGRKHDFARVVERLLTNDALREALDKDDDVAGAARTFFAAPLHEALATTDHPDDQASVTANLISPEYLVRAHELAQDAMIAMARAARRSRARWLLLLTPLAAFSLHAVPIPRLPAALAAAALAFLLYVVTVVRGRVALRSAWGIAPPTGSSRAPYLMRGMVSVAAAFLIAGAPSVLPLRSLHWLGRDRVTGIYEHGDQRLLVLPTARNTYVLRHVTPDCDEFAVVELRITGELTRVSGANTPLARSEGPSFVLLPSPGEGCGERAVPVRFARSKGTELCTVAGEHARALSLAKQPFELAHGASVEVLPWAPNMLQVLVRSDDQIGTLRASELACPGRGLSSLRDTLFSAIR